MGTDALPRFAVVALPGQAQFLFPDVLILVVAVVRDVEDLAGPADGALEAVRLPLEDSALRLCNLDVSLSVYMQVGGLRRGVPRLSCV